MGRRLDCNIEIHRLINNYPSFTDLDLDAPRRVKSTWQINRRPSISTSSYHHQLEVLRFHFSFDPDPELESTKRLRTQLWIRIWECNHNTSIAGSWIRIWNQKFQKFQKEFNFDSGAGPRAEIITALIIIIGLHETPVDVTKYGMSEQQADNVPPPAGPPQRHSQLAS